MKRILSAAAAVLILSGCAADTPAETTAAETTAATTAVTTAAETTAATTTAETTTETTTEETTAETAHELPPPELSDECKALYKALITDIADNDTDGYAYGKLAFDFYDFENDGTPEMFVSNGPSHQGGVDIYTVSGGEIKKPGEDLGEWGEVQVCGERLRSAWFGGGLNSESYYVKNGDSLDILVTFENKDIYEPEEYFINGEKVTKEEYESEQLKYIAAWDNIGRKYYVGKKELELIFG